jgi:hypothetical protein
MCLLLVWKGGQEHGSMTPLDKSCTSSEHIKHINSVLLLSMVLQKWQVVSDYTWPMLVSWKVVNGAWQSLVLTSLFLQLPNVVDTHQHEWGKGRYWVISLLASFLGVTQHKNHLCIHHQVCLSIMFLLFCSHYLYFQQLPVFDIMQTTPFPLQTGQ